jgi:hypothetical protein
MPTISFFLGISIRMFFNDHAPPHFHAVHGRDEAKFSIADGSLISGRMGPKQRRLVKQWTIMYHDALMRCWNAARADQQPERIPGLGADNDD